MSSRPSQGMNAVPDLAMPWPGWTPVKKPRCSSESFSKSHRASASGGGLVHQQQEVAVGEHEPGGRIGQ